MWLLRWGASFVLVFLLMCNALCWCHSLLSPKLFTMSRIDGFNAPSFDSSALLGRGQGDGRAAVGQFVGQQVKVDSGASVLTDAAEEISMHFGGKAENKHSAERKKEAGRPMEMMHIEDIKAYLQQAHTDGGPEKLVLLAKRMLSGQGDPGAQAKQAFPGATEQFMALQYALHQGEQEGVPAEVLDGLREALDDLDMAHGPRIRADMNTIATASAGAQTREDVVHFQDAYNDVVLGDASLAGTLKLALERFGHSDFGAGLGRLIQALGQDLAAARPSADPTRLQSLVQDLYHLEVAATVLDATKELHGRLETQHGGMRSNAVALMQDLVGVSAEKWASGTRFTGLAEKFGANGVEAQIHFLTGVKGLLKDMPVKVFADIDQRQTIFAAVQDALDTAIDREEQ